MSLRLPSRPPVLALAPALALLFSACIVVVDGDGNWHGPRFPWSHGVQGSGVRAEEQRPVAPFREVDLEVGASVLVRVGAPPSLQVVCDDNLLAEVETAVEDGVLTIDLRRSCSFRTRLEIVIGTPSLERFDVDGSGDVRIEDLAGERVELNIEGSGTLQALGRVQRLSGSIEGSGDLQLGQLESLQAELSIEGSGSMEVRVAESLHYSIEGSGSIVYAGAPRVSGRTEGSGSLVRTDP